MYRDVAAVAKSICRFALVVPSWQLAYVLGCTTDHRMTVLMDSMGYDGSDFRLIHGVLMYAVATTGYLDLRRRGLNVSALRYEDLIARPLDMCRVVLEFCHLPASLVQLAVRAFDVDSQRNSILAISAIGPGLFKEPQLTPQTKTKLNELLKKYNMPLIGEPTIIDGTLSCS